MSKVTDGHPERMPHRCHVSPAVAAKMPAVSECRCEAMAKALARAPCRSKYPPPFAAPPGKRAFDAPSGNMVADGATALDSGGNSALVRGRAHFSGRASANSRRRRIRMEPTSRWKTPLVLFDALVLPRRQGHRGLGRMDHDGYVKDQFRHCRTILTLVFDAGCWKSRHAREGAKDRGSC